MKRQSVFSNLKNFKTKTYMDTNRFEKTVNFLILF